ncbi:MAG: hypothetical protein Q9221_003764 [Calogaya cf. arnoldii]
MHPTQKLPTVCAPPSAPSARRRCLQDLESTKYAMSIEEHIYLVEPYRTASMIPPLPLPFTVYPLLPIPQKRLNNDPGVLNQVAEILEQHNILHHEIETGTLTRWVHLARSKIFKKVTSMRILVDVQDDVPTETWPAAIETIKQCLQTRGFPTMQVEILDPKRCRQPSSHHISNEHPLCLEHWDSIEDSVDNTVLAYTSSCRTIEALRPPDNEADSCIICVDVPDQSRGDYGHLRDVLLSIASDAGENVKVAVEFQPRHCPLPELERGF